MKFSSRLFVKIFFCALLETALVSAVIIYEEPKTFSLAHRFSDGFFTAAVLFFSYAGFGFVVSRGAFDAVIFGFKKLFGKEKKSYFDYTRGDGTEYTHGDNTARVSDRVEARPLDNGAAQNKMVRASKTYAVPLLFTAFSFLAAVLFAYIA